MSQKRRPKDYTIKTLHEERKYGLFWYDWTWQLLRPLFALLTSLCLVCGILITGWQMINKSLLMPPWPDDATVVDFIVEKGNSVSKVSANLEEQQFVRNRSVFKYMIDFQGKSGKILPGSYALSRNMTLNQIIEMLTTGDGKPIEREIKVIPGWTIEDIAKELVKIGAIKNIDEFMALATDSEKFKDYYSISELIKDKDSLKKRKYVLEGYLAPDTYRVYYDATTEDIIRRLLSQNEAVIDDVYTKYDEVEVDEEGKPIVPRAEIDITQDEVLILASMIEKEAKTEDFAKVSAVFHNRLKKKMKLQSCVTVQYVLNTKRLALTDSDTSVDSPYNTYKNKGLPIGPVCNPSKAAIQAALNPDFGFMEEGYLFFCSMDPKSGKLFFSKTNEEHEAAVAQYRPLWIEYDNQLAGGTSGN